MRDALLQSRARRLRKQATDAERHLWQYLRGRQIAGHRFRRQVPIAGFVADFACLEAKLVIELDGGQHAQNVGYDRQRDCLIEAQGFRVLRFWDNQVFLETQAALEEIMRALESSFPHPGPAALQVFPCPPQAGEGTVRMDPAPQAGEGNDGTDLSPPPWPSPASGGGKYGDEN